MWLLLKPKLLLAGIALLVLTMFYGTHKLIVRSEVRKAVEATHASMSAEYTKRLLEASEMSREREQSMISSADKLRKDKDAQIVLLNNRVGALLSELRQRPQRPPSSSTAPPSPGSGKGATGAELYREDALVLIGEAQRADRLRAALDQCYRQYDSVRESLKEVR